MNAIMSAPAQLQESPDILELVIRCYDAVIRDLEEAAEMFRSGKEKEVYELIQHAQDIVTELLVGLDYERGGIIAQCLGRIYNFILRELIGMRSGEGCEQLVRILGELRDAWQQISKQ